MQKILLGEVPSASLHVASTRDPACSSENALGESKTAAQSTIPVKLKQMMCLKSKPTTPRATLARTEPSIAWAFLHENDHPICLFNYFRMVLFLRDSSIKITAFHYQKYDKCHAPLQLFNGIIGQHRAVKITDGAGKPWDGSFGWEIAAAACTKTRLRHGVIVLHVFVRGMPPHLPGQLGLELGKATASLAAATCERASKTML